MIIILIIIIIVVILCAQDKSVVACWCWSEALAQRHGSYDVNKHSTVRGVCFFQLRQMVKHMPHSVLFCILQYSRCSKNSIRLKAWRNHTRGKKSSEW